MYYLNIKMKTDTDIINKSDNSIIDTKITDIISSRKS